MTGASRRSGLSDGPADRHPDPDHPAGRTPLRQQEPPDTTGSPADPTAARSWASPDTPGLPADPSAARSWAQAVLREVGLQITRPRQLVLAALRGRERPLTAQDLHAELAVWQRESGTHEAVPGVTTIYRVLAVLAERGVLHCFPQDRAVTAYRLCPPGRHHHLVCRSCGRVQEQLSGPMRGWVEALDVPDGFAVEDYRAELVGLCAECRTGLGPTTPGHPGAPP